MGEDPGAGCSARVKNHGGGIRCGSWWCRLWPFLVWPAPSASNIITGAGQCRNGLYEAPTGQFLVVRPLFDCGGVRKIAQAGYAVPPILGNPLSGIGLHKTVEGSAEKSALFGVRPGFNGSAAGFSAANSGMIFE